MSWVARPEYIEIGPNTEAASLRYQDKATRVFDVAELIVGITRDPVFGPVMTLGTGGVLVELCDK